jgi:hypothetical protein
VSKVYEGAVAEELETRKEITTAAPLRKSDETAIVQIE